MKALQDFGEYTLLIFRTIAIPERWSEFFKQTGKEMYKLAQEIDNSSFNSLKGKYRTLYNLALSKVSF